MSQTDQERVIAERGATLCRKISRCASLPESAQVAAILGAVLDELRPIYDAGAKAGYIAAKEDAATKGRHENSLQMLVRYLWMEWREVMGLTQER